MLLSLTQGCWITSGAPGHTRGGSSSSLPPLGLQGAPQADNNKHSIRQLEDPRLKLSSAHSCNHNPLETGAPPHTHAVNSRIVRTFRYTLEAIARKGILDPCSSLCKTHALHADRVYPAVEMQKCSKLFGRRCVATCF